MKQPNKIISIVFFPHATTIDNQKGISTGQANPKLSALGKKQIINLRKAVATMKFNQVFCSDLIRAKQTARGAFPNRKIESDSRLTEIDIGDFTRKKDKFTESVAYQYINIPFPNGESWKNVETRMRSFLLDTTKKYSGKQIAIIGHQGTQLALEVILNKVSWRTALKQDWRKRNAFQYGWKYQIIS